MNTRRIGQHSVEVEDRRVEVALIDRDCRFTRHCSLTGGIQVWRMLSREGFNICSAQHHYGAARFAQKVLEDRGTGVFPDTPPGHDHEIRRLLFRQSVDFRCGISVR